MSKGKMQLGKLTLMAGVTFLAIICELMPSGILPLISKHFQLTNTEAGALVGIYAIASALFGIPLISLTVEWNRKKLLCSLLLGFAFSNLLVALAPSYPLALIGRVLGGMCVGALWPMITAYGMSIVPIGHQGQAVTYIMSGITVGMCFGLPVMTFVGNQFGYKIAFALMGGIILLLALLSYLFLPAVAGEKRSAANSPITMLKNRGVLLVLIFTFIGVGANYGAYTYLTSLISDIAYPSITEAQIFFGIGSIVAVMIVMNFIDRYFHLLLFGLFALGVLTMVIFYGGQSLFLQHLAFVLWGLTFGSLSSTFQTATARQVKEGTAVANAIQSCSFNLAVMLGSLTSGILLENFGSHVISLVAGVFLAIGAILAVVCRKQLA